jgi:hypothetical protein
MTKKCKKYGLLPPNIAEYDIVVLDHSLENLVGPFTLRTPSKTHSLFVLIMIDPATGWFEIVGATNKSATSIKNLFHNTWLTCYP